MFMNCVRTDERWVIVRCKKNVRVDVVLIDDVQVGLAKVVAVLCEQTDKLFTGRQTDTWTNGRHTKKKENSWKCDACISMNTKLRKEKNVLFCDLIFSIGI